MALVLEDEQAVDVLKAAAPLFAASGAPQPASGKRTAIIMDSDGHTDVDVPGYTTIIVNAGAHVSITLTGAGTAAIMLKHGSNLKLYAYGSGERFIYQEQDSHLDWIDITAGSAQSTAYLAGIGADAKYRGISVGAGDERHDVEANMIHAASRTSSNMLTRTALLGRSTGMYRGRIRILPQATGVDAHQRQDTLLLGDDARMDAIPVLEIENNDVRCSHGVTLGQVDDEQLFYLQARGIGRDEATTMLVQGFFDPLLISIGEQGASVRDELMRKVRHG